MDKEAFTECVKIVMSLKETTEMKFIKEICRISRKAAIEEVLENVLDMLLEHGVDNTDCGCDAILDIKKLIYK